MYYPSLSAKWLGPLVEGNGHRPQKRQLTIHRGVMLLITFLVYATFHASRRPIAIVKGELTGNCTSDDHSGTTTVSPNSNNTDCGWHPFEGEEGKELLGMLDSVYLFTYAICMFVSGYFAERSNLRYFLSIALCVCGLISIAFGLARSAGIHALWYFIAVQFVAGVAQTTGWPATVAVVGEWFGNSKKGLIMGIWNWHTSVGNVVGTAVAAAFVSSDWGLSFIVPGLMCIAVGVLVFVALVPKPSEVGLQVDFTPPEEVEEVVEVVNGGLSGVNHNVHHNVQHSTTVMHKHLPSMDVRVTALMATTTTTTTATTTVQETTNSSSKEALEGAGVKHGEEAISIWQAVRIPGVIEFSVCLFFAKMVSYTFLFWLPMYLKEVLHKSVDKSAYLSIMFDIGGCLGAMTAGFIADRTGASGITCIFFFIFAIPSLLAYNEWCGVSEFANQSLQFIAGAFVNGPYSLITTAVSANLACKVPSQSAMATVSAIIDGTGSIGAAIGPLLAPIVSKGGRWINVFYMCIAADLIAIAALGRIGFEEGKRLLKGRRS